MNENQSRGGRIPVTEDEAAGHSFKMHLTEDGTRVPVTDDDTGGHGFRHLIDEPENDTQTQVTSGHKF